MRSLLLLGPPCGGVTELVAAARRLDVPVHVATHRNLCSRFDRETADGIAGFVFPNFLARQAALDELTRFCRQENIGGVVAGWEHLSSVATTVAARLGLPGNDPDLAEACRNKLLMVRALATGGVSVPHTVSASTYESAEAQLGAWPGEFPVVVKPAENAGSIGVSVIASPGELEEAFRGAQRWMTEFPHGMPLDVTVLMQEYVDGTEFSVETVVQRGACHHLAVIQKFTTSDSTREETGHTAPAALAPDVRRELLATVEKALGVLGFRDGVAHTECKVRPGGTVTVIEIGARPPGDRVMTVMCHARGVDEARAYLQVALGEEPDLTERADAAAAIRFLTTSRSGTFEDVHGIPDSPDVVDRKLYFEPGEPVENYYSKRYRIGHFIVRAVSAEAANKRAQEILDGISIGIAEASDPRP